jgi:hypothetical protein
LALAESNERSVAWCASSSVFLQAAPPPSFRVSCLRRRIASGSHGDAASFGPPALTVHQLLYILLLVTPNVSSLSLSFVHTLLLCSCLHRRNVKSGRESVAGISPLFLGPPPLHACTTCRADDSMGRSLLLTYALLGKARAF